MAEFPFLPAVIPICSLVFAILVFIFRLSTYENVYSSLMVFHSLLPMAAFGSVFIIQQLITEELQSLAYGLISVLSTLATISMWFHCVRGKKFQSTDMSGKVCIVTGANTGIGLETTRELVKMGAKVILGCRSEKKAQQAIKDILNSTGAVETKAEFIAPLDLSSLESVHGFVDCFKKRFESLNVLINNAGIMMHERTMSKDGMEITLQANHLGHALLTVLLLPSLEASKQDARIVNVSSSLYNACNAYDFDDIMSEKTYGTFSVYSKSKLAQVLFSRQLHQQLRTQGSMITVNSVHPGTVRTEITKNMHWIMRFGDMITHPIWLVLRKSPSQGAFTSLHVATSSKLQNVSDKFFEHCEVIPFSSAAKSAVDAAKMYEITLKLINQKTVTSNKES